MTNKSVKALPFPEIENAYLFFSASQRKDHAAIRANISFVYIKDDIAIEWEPEYGPVQVWHACDKDHRDAQEHHIFEYHCSPAGSWSQIAGDSNRLQPAFLAGNYEHIFNVLKRWVGNQGKTIVELINSTTERDDSD